MLFDYLLHAYKVVTFSEVFLSSYMSNSYIQFLTITKVSKWYFSS